MDVGASAVRNGPCDGRRPRARDPQHIEGLVTAISPLLFVKDSAPFFMVEIAHTTTAAHASSNTPSDRTVTAGAPPSILTKAPVAPKVAPIAHAPFYVHHVIFRGDSLEAVRSSIRLRSMCRIEPVRRALLFPKSPGERMVLVVQNATLASVQSISAPSHVIDAIVAAENRSVMSLDVTLRTLSYAGTVTGVIDKAAGIYVLDGGKAWLCTTVGLRAPAATLPLGSSVVLCAVHAVQHGGIPVFVRCTRGSARMGGGTVDVGGCSGPHWLADSVSLPDYLWLRETCDGVVARLSPLLTPSMIWPSHALPNSHSSSYPSESKKCLARALAALCRIPYLSRSVYAEFLNHGTQSSTSVSTSGARNCPSASAQTPGCRIAITSTPCRPLVGVKAAQSWLEHSGSHVQSDADKAAQDAVIVGVVRPNRMGGVELADAEGCVPVCCVDLDVSHFGHVWAVRSASVAADCKSLCLSLKHCRKLATRRPLVANSNPNPDPSCHNDQSLPARVGIVTRRYLPVRDRVTQSSSFAVDVRWAPLTAGACRLEEAQILFGSSLMWAYPCIKEGGVYCFSGTFNRAHQLQGGGAVRVRASDDFCVDAAILACNDVASKAMVDHLIASPDSRRSGCEDTGGGGVAAVVEDPKLDMDGGEYRIDIVSFNGVVVSVAERKGDAVASASGGGAGAAPILCVKVRDVFLPHALDLYVDPARHVIPVGLWPGSRVVVGEALRKVSRNGNVYCNLFARSSLGLSAVCTDAVPVIPPPALGALPTRLLGSLATGTIRLPRASLFRLRATIALVLDISVRCECGRCGRPLSSDECPSGCITSGGSHAKRPVFSIRTRVCVEDGSGEATCYMFDETAIAVLGMSPARVALLRRMSSKHGTVYYSHVSVSRDALLAEGLATGMADVSAGSDSLAAAESVLMHIAQEASLRPVILYCRQHFAAIREDRPWDDRGVDFVSGAQQAHAQAQGQGPASVDTAGSLPYATRTVTLGGVEYVTRMCAKVALKAIAAEECAAGREAARLLDALHRTSAAL